LQSKDFICRKADFTAKPRFAVLFLIKMLDEIFYYIFLLCGKSARRGSQKLLESCFFLIMLSGFTEALLLSQHAQIARMQKSLAALSARVAALEEKSRAHTLFH
jgi:hypothetical protein